MDNFSEDYFLSSELKLICLCLCIIHLYKASRRLVAVVCYSRPEYSKMYSQTRVWQSDVRHIADIYQHQKIRETNYGSSSGNYRTFDLQISCHLNNFLLYLDSNYLGRRNPGQYKASRIENQVHCILYIWYFLKVIKWREIFWLKILQTSAL